MATKAKNIIFWCEFPSRIDWKKANFLFKKINLQTEIYVACKSRAEFKHWKKKSKFIKGVWPILTRKKGYWFSGYSMKEDIDKLDNFSDLPIKIDIEPPIPNIKCSFKLLFTYLLPALFGRAKNNSYFLNKLEKLSKNTEIIVSTFPLPNFLLARFGGDAWPSGAKKNFFMYTTFFPTRLRFLARYYYKKFASYKIGNYDNKVMFALGCIGKGVFGNEPIYKNIKEFKADLDMLTKTKAKTIVIFNLSGLLARKSPEKWLLTIKNESNLK